MEKEQQNLSNIQLVEIERLIDIFKENFKARTSDADNFITIHEIEHMWGEIQQNTLNIYSDMARSYG
jgi:glutamyl-tRNA reductase